MNFEAIQHIPMSQQAHGIDPNHVVFRLRAGRDDLKHCTLFYGQTFGKKGSVPYRICSSCTLDDARSIPCVCGFCCIGSGTGTSYVRGCRLPDHHGPFL